jgi:hypothetical protein
MRSGIGPAGFLATLGIPVLQDLPAKGRDFMDHPILRATLLRPRSQARRKNARHTNCCLTYTSGLGGGERDMIIIACNHRDLPEDGEPSPSGAIGVALYDAFSHCELRLLSADLETNPVVEENMLSGPAVYTATALQHRHPGDRGSSSGGGQQAGAALHQGLNACTELFHADQEVIEGQHDAT